MVINNSFAFTGDIFLLQAQSYISFEEYGGSPVGELYPTFDQDHPADTYYVKTNVSLGNIFPYNIFINLNTVATSYQATPPVVNIMAQAGSYIKIINGTKTFYVYFLPNGIDFPIIPTRPFLFFK
jgi:hypothetical protein